MIPSSSRGRHSLELTKLASYRASTHPLAISVQPSTPESPAIIAVADLMKSLSIIEVQTPEAGIDPKYHLVEVARHFATLWSSAVTATAEHEWLVADMEGNLVVLRRNAGGVTADDQKRLETISEMRVGEVVNKIVPISSTVSPSAASTMGSAVDGGKGKERTRTMSSVHMTDDADERPSPASLRTGPIIFPRAFLATVEGAIYMHGSISAPFVDALLRLQAALAARVTAPGYMPWAKFRAWKTEVREADEPFRYVDGELIEVGLLSLSDEELDDVLREGGLLDESLDVNVEEVRRWGEQLRRLY